MSNPRVLLLGAPGAGKGTQSSRISDGFGVDHITTGDALRANKGMDISELGFEHDTPGEFMDAGGLVPDEVVNEIVVTALDDTDGFVLDGYPRNIEQAEFLDARTELDAVIRLTVDEAELVSRLTGRRVCPDCGENYHVEFDRPAESGICDECGAELIQREDDTEATVRERLRVFAENTEPVIDHYAGTDAYVAIDGEETPDEVWDAVETTIDRRV